MLAMGGNTAEWEETKGMKKERVVMLKKMGYQKIKQKNMSKEI